MTIATRCDSCGRRYEIRDEFAGKTVPCKRCGVMFRVPRVEEDIDDEFFEYERPRRRRRERSPSRSSAAGWVIALCVFTGLVVVGAIGAAIYFGTRGTGEKPKNDNVTETSEPTGASPPVEPNDPPPEQPPKVLPNFPAVLPPHKLHPTTGAKIYFVDLAAIPGNQNGPGRRMKMRVYLPAGNHAAKSLGCVLVAPAGTRLFHGNDMDNDDYHAETLPYVQAGYAVVFYSIDGHIENFERSSNATIAAAYQKFKAADAGVLNGKYALEFVRASVPQVDPNRIYTAGHSSAAVLALLLAAKEPRIKGCIAYAAAADVEMRLADLINNPTFQKVLPGFAEFIRDSSPTNYALKYRCPLFIFHSRDDRNEPIRSAERFVSKLKAAGKNVTFSIANSGGHYQSMINPGIPRGIAWLKNLPTERGRSFPATRQPPPTTNRRPPRVTRIPPRTTGRGPTITFQVQGFNGRGSPRIAAIRALRFERTIRLTSVRYDATNKTLSVQSLTSSVSTASMKTALQRAGFVIGSTSVSFR